MLYAAALRPVIDRVYSALRRAGGRQVRAVYERFDRRPGLELEFYFGLLARPLPAEALADATVYRGIDLSGEPLRGVVERDGRGAWRLTSAGRELCLSLQQAVGEGAAELWANPPLATMPGPEALPRLNELLARLLEAGQAGGGAAFRALSPPFEPEAASPELTASTRLGALRHHRADAHRAAWRAAGLEVDDLPGLDVERRAEIEAETNRRDEPLYSVLSEAERLELLATLGALSG